MESRVAFSAWGEPLVEWDGWRPTLRTEEEVEEASKEAERQGTFQPFKDEL